MNASGGLNSWRLALGVVAIGVFACSPVLLGAPPTHGGAVSERAGAPPLDRLAPVAVPVHAYRAETVILQEGGGVLPLSMGLDGSGYNASVAGVATTACRANSDCDDCNSCTTDVCTVVPPSVLGTCANTAVSQCASCSDGAFCNGPEICDLAGVCREGAPGLPCNQPGEVCDPIGGPLNQGSCGQPCAIDSDCNDQSACTGTEVCLGGLCRATLIPCGSAVACLEDFCDIPGLGHDYGDPCAVDGDCGAGGHCTVGAGCVINGRCCVDDGSGSLLACSRSNRPDCIGAGGRWLFVGDDPGTETDEANCSNPAPPTASNAGETFNCPAYASGIDSEIPLDSLVAVGQVGAASCNALQEIGDDYKLAGLSPGQHLEVSTVRFIGGFQTDGIVGSASRIRITFYDKQGNFIEDTITNPFAQGDVQLRTIIYAEKPIVPEEGFMAIRAAVRFSPFGKHTWMGGVPAADTGLNDANLMWMNGAPVDASLVMGGSPGSPTDPGIMAFEIVGNIVEDPSGACCDALSGTCASVLPWLCEQDRCSDDQNLSCEVDGDCVAGTCLPPGAFQGPSTDCKVCRNDPFLSCVDASGCPACAGVPGTCQIDGTTACTTATDCIPVGGGVCIAQACDPNTECPGGVCTGGICVGGTNDTLACNPDVDCGGGTCTATEACDNAPPACTREACCPDTPDGTCTPIVGGGGGCPALTTSRGAGTNCDPNLCIQPDSGYDTCADAALPGNIKVFDVASMQGCETETWTVTGNNLNATFNDNTGNPATDTCGFGMFDQGGGTQDRGWWHSFSINACANVRMDFCGTEELFGEIKQPAWANLWNACNPCSTTVAASVVGGLFEGGCVGTPDSNGDRGGPFCARDDLWETYGPLPAGTYWYPIYSAPNGTYGGYQFHITVSACPKAACCLPESMCLKVDDSLVFDVDGNGVACADDPACALLKFCDNSLDTACSVDADCPACVGGPTPDASCSVDADCGAGGLCSGTSTCRAATCGLCALANTFDCGAVDGKWNGFGSTRVQCSGGTCEGGTCVGGPDEGEACDPAGGDPITSCLGGPCEIGSCCTTNPSACEDRASPDTACNPANASTCMSRSQCTGTFRGGAGCDDDIAPCPTCEFIDANNCNFPLGAGFTYMSDLSLANGAVTADDFIPLGADLHKVCVWGTYMDPTGPGQPGDQGYEQFSCVGPAVQTGEEFRVRVFADAVCAGSFCTGAASSVPCTTDADCANLPGAVVGESLVSGANIASGPERNTTFEATFGIIMQGYTLTLNTAITGMAIGQKHWLEVADFTPEPLDNTCYWNWAMHIPPVNDGYCAAGLCLGGTGANAADLLARPSVYVNGSGKGGLDMAFCLHGASAPLDFDAPADPVGCCWDCAVPPGNAITTLLGCIQTTGIWDRSDPGCLNSEPPPQPNDVCATAPAPGSVAGSAFCGDGVIEAGEQCDPPVVDICDADCQLICTADTPVGEGALVIGDGLYRLDNACANIDGPSAARGEGSDFAIDGDIWYEYTAGCTGLMSVDMCSTQSGWNKDGYTGLDSSLAIYHESVTRCQGGTNAGLECVCDGIPPAQRCVVPAQCPGGVVCVGPNDPPGCDVDEIGLCRNECPCPGLFTGVHPDQVGDGSDEGCNGIADAGSGLIERVVFPDECYLIRVGAWMSVGNAEGTGNRGRGLMSVGCTPQDCFPSSAALAALGESTGSPPTLVPWPKPRMISFSAGDAGASQAIRVTFTQMPPGWGEWVGQSLFVQEPWDGSEKGGVSFYDNPAPAGDVTLRLAQLDCNPYFTDWSVWGDINVIHPAIAPSKLVVPAGPVDVEALYTIEVIEESCALNVAGNYSDPLVLRTAAWADVAELDGGTYRVPGDVVSVVDTLAMVAKFSGDPAAPSKASMCLLGVTAGPEATLDGKITISETVSVLGAFGGTHYPFLPASIAPPPGQCPP